MIQARVIAVLSIALGAIFSVEVAKAGDLRWPRSSDLPASAKPARPAVIVIAPGRVEPRVQRVTTRHCMSERACVVCVANCSDEPPQAVYTRRVQPTQTREDAIAQGTPPASARPGWADIACGQEGGCRVSGISAAPRPRETYITIIGNFYRFD
jgi:hypothetical protein